MLKICSHVIWPVVSESQNFSKNGSFLTSSTTLEDDKTVARMVNKINRILYISFVPVLSFIAGRQPQP